MLPPRGACSSFTAGKRHSRGQHLPWDTLQGAYLCTPLAGGRTSRPTRFGSRDGCAWPGGSPLPFPSLLPSWRRASPAVTRPSRATCLLRQMRWERDGGERAERCGGGVGRPRNVWALAPKHLPGLPGTLGCAWACWGEGVAGVPKPHPACPCALAQALFMLPAMLRQKTLFAPSPSARRSAGLVDATCAMSPAHAWHALAKAGWGHGYPVLSEAVSRVFGHWREAGHITALLGAGASSPCCQLGFAWRNVDGLVLYQRAQCWVSVPGSEFAPEMVLSGQHKAAVKATPLGSGVGGCRPAGWDPPGQGGVPVTRECLWPAMHWPGGYVPPGRAGRGGSSTGIPCLSHACLAHSIHATLSSPPLLWDSPPTSVLLVHEA